MFLVGIDIGGTFTDIALYDSAAGRLAVHKVRSTRDDPGRALIRGILELCAKEEVDPSRIGGILHGTTVATNAVLEHRGAKTAMVTTDGMRDVVHIGRHQRPQPYSITQDIPWQASPFVRRADRVTVPERTAPSGDVVTELDVEGTVDIAVLLTLRSILVDSDQHDPVATNAGLFRPITVSAPNGSIANPVFPAPTIARFCSGDAIADAVMRAMAPVVPESVAAGVGNLYELTDRGAGAGQWRGGFGSILDIQFLEDGGFSLEGEGNEIPPPGLFGGEPGTPGAVILNPDGDAARSLPSKLPYEKVAKGSVLRLVGPCGGGYGDPSQRAPEAIAADGLA